MGDGGTVSGGDKPTKQGGITVKEEYPSLVDQKIRQVFSVAIEADLLAQSIDKSLFGTDRIERGPLPYCDGTTTIENECDNIIWFINRTNNLLREILTGINCNIGMFKLVKPLPSVDQAAIEPASEMEV